MNCDLNLLIYFAYQFANSLGIVNLIKFIFRFFDTTNKFYADKI